LRDDEVEYGVLVDPADPEDIARGLERVLSDPATWRTFAQRGRQRVMDRYTWDRTAAGYLTRIEEIVANPDARRPKNLLPIHPYFREPTSDNAVTLEELADLYFARSEES
jgi:sucrose-phosphate synthase